MNYDNNKYEEHDIDADVPTWLRLAPWTIAGIMIVAAVVFIVRVAS